MVMQNSFSRLRPVSCFKRSMLMLHTGVSRSFYPCLSPDHSGWSPSRIPTGL